MFPVSLELYVLYALERSLQRHQSVGGAHPQPAQPVFGYGARVQIQVVVRIVCHAVVSVPEHGLAPVFLYQVQSAAERAYPYTLPAVLICVIHTVVAYRCLVAVAVRISCYPHALRCHFVGRCLYKSGSFCRKPQVAASVFHYMIYVADIPLEAFLYVSRGNIHAVQLSVACAYPQVAVARLVKRAHSLALRAYVGGYHQLREYKPEVVLREVHLVHTVCGG